MKCTGCIKNTHQTCDNRQKYIKGLEKIKHVCYFITTITNTFYKILFSYWILVSNED